METGNRIYFFFLDKGTSHVGEIKEKGAIPLYIFTSQNILKFISELTHKYCKQVPFCR